MDRGRGHGPWIFWLIFLAVARLTIDGGLLTESRGGPLSSCFFNFHFYLRYCFLTQFQSNF